MDRNKYKLAGVSVRLMAITVSLLTSGQSFAGSVRVIDGDTLVLAGETIRLDGIDAPELAQTCLTKEGAAFPCGRAARDHLTMLINTGPVTCDGSAVDRYDRRIATCFAGRKNLNKAMVDNGYAYAFLRYSARYRQAQENAQMAGRGIWSGHSEAPWDFRKKKWQVAGASAPEGCPIKGNISTNGRIYHTPWSPHYTRTRINEAAGERWFCSEEEAVAAGWRAPLS